MDDSSAMDRILLEAGLATREEAIAYLRGATHDATFSARHNTIRFCQADRRWLEMLEVLLRGLGESGWLYREGRHRNLWILETCWRPVDIELINAEPSVRAAYARAYFDAEGGIPRDPRARFYIQFVQKNRMDISNVRDLLGSLDISCGRLHNPSKRVDPNYWRFFVLVRSYRSFTNVISSWHPRKRNLLEQRVNQANSGLS